MDFEKFGSVQILNEKNLLLKKNKTNFFEFSSFSNFFFKTEEF